MSGSAGERWVERYLLPIVNHRLRRDGTRSLTCLQIEPDDETEAIRLRRDGHRCDILLLDAARAEGCDWQERPLVRDSIAALHARGAYDLVLTGYFGRLGRNRAGRLELAHQLHAACRGGGAFLTAIGNRRCPVDLTGNASRLHGPSCDSLVTLREMERIFVGAAGFAAVQPLTLAGHFGMSRARGLLAPAAWLMAAHWRWVAVPERRWLYASPLNPVLMLWIQK